MSTDESTTTQPEEERTVVDLADLVGEPTVSFKWEKVEYFIHPPLSLTLHQAAATESAARDVNALGAKAREGTATEPELKKYEDALTKYAKIVTIGLPEAVLQKMNWWQKLAVVGLFQSQRQTRPSKEGGEATDENPTVETADLQTTVT